MDGVAGGTVVGDVAGAGVEGGGAAVAVGALAMTGAGVGVEVATAGFPGWNARMNATMSLGSVRASANLSFIGSMNCPFPSSMECTISASVREACHLGSVRSGIVGMALRTIAPRPSASWHAMQIARYNCTGAIPTGAGAGVGAATVAGVGTEVAASAFGAAVVAADFGVASTVSPFGAGVATAALGAAGARAEMRGAAGVGAGCAALGNHQLHRPIDGDPHRLGRGVGRAVGRQEPALLGPEFLDLLGGHPDTLGDGSGAGGRVEKNTVKK